MSKLIIIVGETLPNEFRIKPNISSQTFINLYESQIDINLKNLLAARITVPN